MNTESHKIISELDEYIALCKSRLEPIMSVLGWNEEDTLKENHRLREKPTEPNLDKDDPLLPESFGCKYSIVIGEDQLNSILKTSQATIATKFSDIQLNFTREQKREIYDYVIYNTGKVSEPELKVSQRGNDMTFAEIVAKAKKKDKKLKRKYRTSKPTHIEEVRNLVYLQMQALEQYFNSNTSDLKELDRPVQRDEKREEIVHEMRRRSREELKSPYHHTNSGSRSRYRKDHSRERNIKTTNKIRGEHLKARSPSPHLERSEGHHKRDHSKSSKKKSRKRSRSKSKNHRKSKKSKKKRDREK